MDSFLAALLTLPDVGPPHLLIAPDSNTSSVRSIMNLSEFLMVLYFSFVISINLYLSINIILLKLSFSYESGKIWGGA